MTDNKKMETKAAPEALKVNTGVKAGAFTANVLSVVTTRNLGLFAFRPF